MQPKASVRGLGPALARKFRRTAGNLDEWIGLRKPGVEPPNKPQIGWANVPARILRRAAVAISTGLELMFLVAGRRLSGAGRLLGGVLLIILVPLVPLLAFGAALLLALTGPGWLVPVISLVGASVAFVFLIMAAGALLGALAAGIVSVAWRYHRRPMPISSREGPPLHRLPSAMPQDGSKSPVVANQDALAAEVLSNKESIARSMAALGEHAPSLPRAAKRVLNNLRLTTLIAARRQLFKHPLEGTTPESLAKWANLCERWPGVATVCRFDPNQVPSLETAARDSSTFELKLRELGLPLSSFEREALRQYLLRQPSLGPRAWATIRLELPPIVTGRASRQ